MGLTRRHWMSLSGAVSAIMIAVPLARAENLSTDFDVHAYKAVGDGRTVNTRAIQAAIDACAVAGGGRVVLKGGAFVTGTLYLKSHVTLYIETGASLLGSPDIADYTQDTHQNMYANEPHMDRCLIFARDAENIGLEGRGTIDGQGKSFPNKSDVRKNRPMMIRFLNCANISVRELTLMAPAAWTSAFLYCSGIVADGLTIKSRANGNGDGLDFDGCQDVRVANCTFDTSDDAICLQASLPEKPVRNVVITNCIMTTRWAAIRIGLLSCGDFHDVTVSNCVFHDIVGEGIKIQMTEGGAMSNFLFSNIVMRNVPRAVLITFNSFPMRIDSPNPMPPMRSLRNIRFSHMRIDSDQTMPGPQLSFMAISGVSGHLVENVTFSDIHFTAPGGGTKAQADRRTVGEFSNVRPESRVFEGSLPAYGLYARHVKGLEVRNMRLETLTRDVRPAIVLDDVEAAAFSGLRLGADDETEHVIRLQNVKDVLFEGCASLAPCDSFVRIEGAGSNDIALMGNDLRRVKKAVDLSPEVSRKATYSRNNLESR